MARFLKHPDWYEQILPETLSESELEQKVVLYAPFVYSDYYVIPFKLTVDSPYGAAKPDLAFIARDYKDWLVVEVEMGYHDLKSHVELQVQQLVNATYDSNVVRYLCGKEPKLDYERTLNLINSNPSRVLLILNEPKPEWSRALSKYGTTIATFELFRSLANDEVYRINGEYPNLIVSSVSDCFMHPLLPILGVRNPGQLDLARGQRIRLRFSNCITYWERNDDPGGTVWLIPTGRNPLNPNRQYRIVRMRDNSLVLMSSS